LASGQAEETIMSSNLTTLKFEQLKAIKWRDALLALLMPFVGVLAFILLWHTAAPNINTSLGDFPQPKQVYEQWGTLVDEYKTEQAREAVFYERQEKRNAELLAQDPHAKMDERTFNGRPTFFDKVETSLVTVLSGFFVASAIAIPLGIMIGLSQTLYSAFNPLIQLFKPVSPLAWLPLVTIVVSAVYVSDSPMFSKSYIISLLTVSLCSLWPTMINTAVGVAGVSKDLLNVSRVLRLSWFTHVIKIVLPSAIPMMFTGLRISLGIAWMVLIAAEMLSQNPGLGKFVWDEFQNGSSDSLSRICLAILVIGLIGFLLDRIILLAQTYFNWDKSAVVR
jgi:nitrate/nitrite transport system permease protein